VQRTPSATAHGLYKLASFHQVNALERLRRSKEQKGYGHSGNSAKIDDRLMNEAKALLKRTPLLVMHTALVLTHYYGAVLAAAKDKLNH
jgi:hypothetical protein